MRHAVLGLGSALAVAFMVTAGATPASEEAHTETVWTAQLKGIAG